MNPCKVCDADNPNGLLLCKVCKAPLTQTNPSYEQPLLTKPKMAVVNIDRALLDNTNFETDRKAKRLKKGSAEHTRMITEKLEMQTVSPEAKQFLDSLVDQGLVIGFISEKHQGHMSRQKNHLQNLGLPIMIDSSGVLLKSGGDSKILNDWGSRYDIQYYFGDAVKTARKKGIPGTYDTVNGYIGAPIKNPAIMMEETPAPYALVNPSTKSKVLPIMSGEPSGKHKKLGAVFAEVQVGRNIIVDVGEGIQDMYRGLIGGRQSMTEKRMAMAIATMHKELSDRAKALGGNAVANLKIDFELPKGKLINLMATADAIKMARPPKTNPSSKTKKKKSKKVKAAEKAYKDFHGGKKPKKVETVSVEFSDVWYCLGPVWCIGYMSDKEGFGEQQKYIHHTNEESKDGDFPMLYATMPESGEQMFMIKGGTMKVSARDGLDWLID